MRWSFQAAAFFAIIGVSLAAGARAADLRPDSSRIVSVASAFPLVFEENRGQADSTVRFLSRSPGFDLLLRSDEAVFVLRGRERTAERISLRWRGAACEPEVFGDELLASKSSDFHGSDPSRWLRGIDQYGRVTYPELYPGIGLSFYGSAGRLEHDFFVSAGADPRSIRLEIAGARRVRIDARGDLILSTESGDVVARAPEIYQSIAGRRVAVAGGWTLRSPRHAGGPAEAGFEIGRYDRGAPLVIDPILSYATYLGGTSSDNGYGIAVDGQGNAYVVGAAFSGDFPLQNPIDDSAVSGDAFVTKLSNGGSTLMYSTRLGGSGFDNGYGIALDSSGNAYVSGTTFSTDFPTTPGAYRETAASSADVWVAKLNATGTALVYATRIGHFAGGSNEPRYTSVAVDSGGNAYVTGVTDALDFPTTPGAFSRTLGTQPFNGGYNTDAFVTKLNPAGSALVYSTYLGGIGDDGGYGIRVDGAGSAYVTGVAGTNGFNQSDFPTTPGAYQQAAGHSGNASFVAKLKPDGSGLVFATLVGGTIGQSQGFGIAIDGEGCSYVTGETTPHFTGQNDFPTTPGAVQPAYGGSNADAFAYKLNASGSGLVYSTFLGGSGYENVFGSGGIAVDGNHDAYVIGHTASNNFPTSHSLQVYKGGGFTGDAFLVKLNPTGTALAYSTFLGGTKDEYGADVAVDAVGNAYVTGTTFSSDFPATPNSFQTSSKGFSSVFIAKIGELTSFDVAAVVPNEGGDTGTAAVLVEGAGFQPGVSVKLRRSGHADIVGDPLGLSPDGTSLDTLFDLHGAAQGAWDLVVTNPGGGSATLAGGFTVTPGRAADLWVDVVGSPNLRGGKSQRYQIVYGNRSPDAALGTLLWIAFPKYLDYKLDFALTPPPLPPGVPAVDFSQIPISFDTDTETVIPLFIGVIPSGITGTLPIELRVPDDPQYAHAKFEIRVWMNAPFFGSPLDPQAEKCLRTVTKTILSRVMEVLIKKFMPVDCVTGAGSAMKEIFENTLEAIVKGQQGTYNGADAAKSLTQMLCPALQQGLECAFELSGLVVPEVKVLQVVLEIIPFLLDLNEVLDDCGNPLSPKFGRNFPAEVITSNDPNDKFGSVGGGAPAHFLTGSEPLRYVVHFTNEDTATAPAQDVVVTDQLDPAKVDLSTFAFGPISFGAITVFRSSPTGRLQPRRRSPARKKPDRADRLASESGHGPDRVALLLHRPRDGPAHGGRHGRIPAAGCGSAGGRGRRLLHRLAEGPRHGDRDSKPRAHRLRRQPADRHARVAQHDRRIGAVESRPRAARERVLRGLHRPLERKRHGLGHSRIHGVRLGGRRTVRAVRRADPDDLGDLCRRAGARIRLLQRRPRPGRQPRGSARLAGHHDRGLRGRAGCGPLGFRDALGQRQSGCEPHRHARGAQRRPLGRDLSEPRERDSRKYNLRLDLADGGTGFRLRAPVGRSDRHGDVHAREPRERRLCGLPPRREGRRGHGGRHLADRDHLDHLLDTGPVAGQQLRNAVDRRGRAVRRNAGGDRRRPRGRRAFGRQRRLRARRDGRRRARLEERDGSPLGLTAAATGLSGPGATYSIDDVDASYGILAPATR